jgi:hypothetical protein
MASLRTRLKRLIVLSRQHNVRTDFGLVTLTSRNNRHPIMNRPTTRYCTQAETAAWEESA